MESLIINFQRLVLIIHSFIRFNIFDISDELDQEDLEQTLRKMSFGYRARYIQQAVKYLKYSINDPTFFDQLKSSPVKESRTRLLKIMGVGRKVTSTHHI